MVEVQVKHLKFRESFKPECRTLLDLVVVHDELFKLLKVSVSTNFIAALHHQFEGGVREIIEANFEGFEGAEEPTFLRSEHLEEIICQRVPSKVDDTHLRERTAE